jgi:hypothetical protein
MRASHREHTAMLSSPLRRTSTSTRRHPPKPVGQAADVEATGPGPRDANVALMIRRAESGCTNRVDVRLQKRPTLLAAAASGLKDGTLKGGGLSPGYRSTLHRSILTVIC